MNYKNEVIHFIGGMQPYIGRLDEKAHPNGPGWYRILEPCTYQAVEDQQNNRIRAMMTRIWGLDKLYLHYIDVYCPSDSLMEIRVLDQNGALYKQYKDTLAKPSLSKIVAPSSADVRAITSNKG